jgi:hypothetical protein
VNSVEQQFSFQSLYYEIFTLTRFVDITDKPGFSQILCVTKIMVMRVMKTGITKCCLSHHVLSIYSKRATIACHGFLRGQEFSLEHMIDCIIGNDMYLCTCGLE